MEELEPDDPELGDPEPDDPELEELEPDDPELGDPELGDPEPDDPELEELDPELGDPELGDPAAQSPFTSRSSPASTRQARSAAPPWSSVPADGEDVRVLVGEDERVLVDELPALASATWALAGTRRGTASEKVALPTSPMAAGMRATSTAAR